MSLFQCASLVWTLLIMEPYGSNTWIPRTRVQQIRLKHTYIHTYTGCWHNQCGLTQARPNNNTLDNKHWLHWVMDASFVTIAIAKQTCSVIFSLITQTDTFFDVHCCQWLCHFTSLGSSRMLRTQRISGFLYWFLGQFKRHHCWW